MTLHKWGHHQHRPYCYHTSWDDAIECANLRAQLRNRKTKVKLKRTPHKFPYNKDDVIWYTSMAYQRKR